MAGTVVVGAVVWLASGAGPAAQKSKGPVDPQRVTRIQPAELQKLLAKDQAVLVDVRSAQAYERGHLDGALSIPAAEIEKKASELRRRAGARTVVLYCSCAFEYAAAEAAVRLARLGITRVSVLQGGYMGSPEAAAPDLLQ
jgi:rhodanese-related sulfurtransferase